jgi:hypothetical protein
MILGVDGKAGKVSIGVVGEAVHVLPGIIESIGVNDSLLVDSVKKEGKSGSTKVIHGWEDADLSLKITLLDDPAQGKTRFDYLAEITGWFTKVKDGKPQVFTVHHPLLAAWGSRQFIYYSLDSSETRGKQKISCSLEFDEYDSSTGKSQERQMGAKAAVEESAPAQPPVSDKTRMGLGKLEAHYGG